MYNELLIPASLRNGDNTLGSVFDVVMDRYEALSIRTEEMIVKHVSAEVENDLKQHLTRSVVYWMTFRVKWANVQAVG